MADQEPAPSQDEQPKMEEPNAPINIKVRQTWLVCRSLGGFLAGGGCLGCGRKAERMDMCMGDGERADACLWFCRW